MTSSVRTYDPATRYLFTGILICEHCGRCYDEPRRHAGISREYLLEPGYCSVACQVSAHEGIAPTEAPAVRERVPA